MNMRYATEFEYESLRSKATELARGYKELDNEHNALLEKYNALHSEHEKLCARYDRNNKVIDSFIADIKEHEAVAASLQTENTTLRNQVNELAAKLATSEAENAKVCGKFTAAYKASQCAIAYRDMIIKREHSLSTEYKDALDTATEKCKSLSINALEQEVAINDLEGRYNALNQLHETLFSEHLETIRERTDLNNQLSATENMIEQLNTTIVDRERELNHAIDEIIKLQSAPKRYRYKVIVSGGHDSTVYIEYNGRIYYPDSYETIEYLYKDKSGAVRALYYTTTEKIDANDPKCVLKSRNQRGEGYAPIGFAQIE
ncbi:hypothetical protein F-VV10_0033 [Faustovirus]|nr:hypothetical protein F-VV10_0033 [Faustovirus]